MDNKGWIVAIIIILNSIVIILSILSLYIKYQKSKIDENFNTKFEILKDTKIVYKGDTVYVKAKSEINDMVILSTWEPIHIDSVVLLIKNK
ncbi:MAG: hypothetical protein M0R46_15235 [Candidatus Muirbacterium halophilum]|nr:hypothetical protein [Candidatus Muirbacterium halophilum]